MLARFPISPIIDILQLWCSAGNVEFPKQNAEHPLYVA